MSFVKFSPKFCVAITNFMLVKSDLNILEANPLVLLRFSSSHGTDYGWHLVIGSSESVWDEHHTACRLVMIIVCL